MRWLLGAVVAVAVLWSGAWFAGSRLLQDRLAAALSAAAPQVGVAEVSLAGFPNRFDVTFRAPSAVSPDGSLVWSAPFLQVLTLAYRPWHVVVAFPPEQRFDWPGGGAALAAEGRLRASLVVRPVAGLPFARAQVEGATLALRPDAGMAVSLATLQAAAETDPADPLRLRLGVEAFGLAPDPALLAALPARSALPPAAERLFLDATLTLSSPAALGAGPPLPVRAVEISGLALRWGPVALDGRGRIAADAQGFAAGEIALRLEGWQAALDAAVALGVLAPGVAETWAEFARRWSTAAGSGTVLEMPLTLSQGRMALGPIPLGPAPWLGVP
jgi:hypothetical protein